MAHPPIGDLGEFLRARRASMTPDHAGLPSYGFRRVPGLRREELAQLAGVSPAYYTRLEQGQSTNASAGVLDALARALELDDDERVHLHTLAHHPGRKRRRAAPPDHAHPDTIRLLGAMPTVPAVVLGRRNEILAWNKLGHALIAGHIDVNAPTNSSERPNVMRMLFLDPHTRELYRNWAEEAALVVASLRFIASQYAEDRELIELTGELLLKSREFAALWARHPVRRCTSGTKSFHHPEVGDFDVRFTMLHLPDTSGHRIITYLADPGSQAADALALLAVTIGHSEFAQPPSAALNFRFGRLCPSPR